MNAGTIRNLVALLLLVTSGISHGYNYNDWAVSNLKSIFNAKEAYISVSVDTRFINGPLVGDKVDKDLGTAGVGPGRVSNNIKTLLSEKLQRLLFIKSVGFEDAPYQIQIDVRIVQIREDFVEVLLHINFQEAAVTLSGRKGYMTVDVFQGQAFGRSKEESEARVHEALDLAFKEMYKKFEEASKYCASAGCK